MTDYILEMRNITKKFGALVANDDITIQVRRGEILAISGENGAGKSTLMSILFGLYNPDKGKILINGREVKIKDPNDANRYKIGMVHQHFKLVPTFSALENIVLGIEPVKHGLLSFDDVRKRLESLIDKYHFSIDLDMKVMDMTVGMQQRVEILKMLYRDNDILIFDEPTAVLTPQEIDELINILFNLQSEGKTIIFISHKLAEVMKVSERCTVLWKGKCVGTVKTKDTSKEQISEMMVGRKVQLVPDKKPVRKGKEILQVRNLTVWNEKHEKRAVKNVSFEVCRGEIVCIAGIDGNGQTELVQALTGLLPAESGNIIFAGEEWKDKGIRYRNTHGLAYVPEDRHKHGLVLDYTLEQNLILKKYFEPPFQRHGIINNKAVRSYSERLRKDFDIRTGDSASMTVVRSMSGGNQQKAILAREVDMNPELLIAMQPTRGLDVGAIEYIQNHLIDIRDKGNAVLLVSLEMEEILNVSDRILVMYNGEIVCNLDARGTNSAELGLYMAGVKREERT